MELVYLYVQAAHGEEYDLHLDFSQNTKVRFDKDTKEFHVEKLNNEYPLNFFGENIKNITGIFGKNGVGKTTLFNILSLLNNSLVYKDAIWMILYADGDDYFIEGNVKFYSTEIQRLHQLNPVYSLKGNFKNGDFEIECFLQDDKKFKSGVCYLTFLPDEVKSPNCLFKRIFVNETESSSLFKLLASAQFNNLFEIGSKTYFSLLLESPNFVGDSLISNSIDLKRRNKINNFLDVLKEKYKRFNFGIVRKEDINISGNKNLFKLYFYRIVFDNFFNFLVFLLKEMDGYRDFFDQLLGKIEDIIDKYSSDRAILENVLFLQEHIGIFHNEYGRYLSDYMAKNLLRKEWSFKKFSEVIDKLDDKYFTSESRLEIQKGDFPEVVGVMEDILEVMDSLNYYFQIQGTSIVTISFGQFSSGEIQLLELFSSIHEGILKGNNEYELIVVLLDEYEKHLHPEWSRLFLFYLNEFLATYRNQYFQVILSSHSPYLISDLPRNNVRLINVSNGNRNISIPKHSFASNYYDILSDSFFLEDTIGEFAKQKINGWITELNELENSSDFDSDFAKLTRIDEIKELINIVDDQFIRNKLLELAEDVKGRIEGRDDKDLQKYLLDQQIAELQKRRKALDLEDNDD